MSIIQVKTAVPGLGAANSIMGKIKQIGIQDVEMMFDKDIQMWAVVQVFKPTGKIILLDKPEDYQSQPYILWWCKTPQGTYREPNDQDLHDVVVTVKRAAVVFDKGSDWMIDKIEAKEKADYDENRRKQSEKIRSIAPAMKKAIKKGDI